MIKDIPYIDVNNKKIKELYKPIIYSEKPQLIFLHDFLNDEMCDYMINLSEKNNEYKRGTVYNKDGTGRIDENRTNDAFAFDEDYNETIIKINEKISDTCNWYKKRANRLNILRYSEGQKFKWHNDFHENEYALSITKKYGQRYATMVIYLNDVEKGGETIFKHLKKIVKPKKGCALFWNYDIEKDPENARLTEHGGNTVQKGTKYILTRWLTNKEY